MASLFQKIRINISNEQLYLVVVFPCVALLAALVIRIQCGNTLVFYACYCHSGIFPSRFFYAVIYIIRLISSGLLLGFALILPGFYKARLKAAVASLAGLVAVLFEYKLLFFYESFLVVVIILALSGYFCFKSAMSDEYLCSKRKDWACICVVFSLLQLIMAVMVLSLMI